MSDLPVLTRPLRETDKPLILDSWVNSVCYSMPAFFWVPVRITVACPECDATTKVSISKRIYRHVIEKLLNARPDLFHVLVNEDDDDQIFAWICGDRRATHFVFVKRAFRREGLANLLFRKVASRRFFSNWSNDCERIHNLKYKPSLFRELINGINQAVGSSPTQDDKHVGQVGANITDRREGQACSDSVGMVT